MILLSATVLLLFFDGCKKKDDGEGPDPNNNGSLLQFKYEGTLHLLFSNTFPAFQSSTTLQVSVDLNGHMVFSIGELQYSGESDNGQSKIRREGELILAPNGDAFEDDNKIYFAVDENTSLEETFTVWIWDGTIWVQQIQETVTDTWNNGLNFALEDAQLGGSVVEESNANGTVRWTLVLIPKLDGK